MLRRKNAYLQPIGLPGTNLPTNSRKSRQIVISEGLITDSGARSGSYRIGEDPSTGGQFDGNQEVPRPPGFPPNRQAGPTNSRKQAFLGPFRGGGPPPQKPPKTPISPFSAPAFPKADLEFPEEYSLRSSSSILALFFEKSSNRLY